MISNISDLLEALRHQGEKDIKAATNPKHPGMIGDMYEGLTKELMSRAIFHGLDLRVGDGKIKNMTTGAMSRQIDCMIYQGDAEILPHTSHRVVDIRKVVAVIEVKKYLHSAELLGAYQNLRSVVEIFDSKDIELDFIKTAFEAVTGLAFPATKYELSAMPYEQQRIYHSLVVESCLPLRIIYGYEGFKQESYLRNAFAKMLQDNAGQKGFNVTSFPNLIISGSNSLIKTQGIPYALHAENSADWFFYASFAEKPLWLLLELLWSRLTYQFHISGAGLFDELHNERLHPFLLGKPVKNGWAYSIIPLDDKDTETVDDLWQPLVVSLHEFVIFNMLCENGPIKIDGELRQYFHKNSDTVDNFLKKYVNERIIVVKNGFIDLMTTNLMCLLLPDGRYVIGENVNNRFIQWLNEHFPPRHNHLDK